MYENNEGDHERFNGVRMSYGPYSNLNITTSSEQIRSGAIFHDDPVMASALVRSQQEIDRLSAENARLGYSPGGCSNAKSGKPVSALRFIGWAAAIYFSVAVIGAAVYLMVA